MNIGDLLTTTHGASTMPTILSGDTVSTSLMTAPGAEPPSFGLVRAASAYQISILFAESCLDTGNATVGTVFGSYVGDTFTPIYVVGETNSPTQGQSFNPTAPGSVYGFYATVCYAVGVCETYTTGNGNWGNEPGGAGWNHFALFQLASGAYVIGFEDTNGIFAEGAGDYNDVIIELSNAEVPEPRQAIALGLALAACYLYRARSRRLHPTS